MKTIELTIGHNVQGRARWNTEDVTQAAMNVLNIEALTAIPCIGAWRGEREDSTRIEIAGLTDEVAETIMTRVPLLADALQQEAIMIATRELQTVFVEPTLAIA